MADPRVSLALRARRAGGVGLSELAAALGLTPAALRRGLADLERAGFTLERHPTEGIRLVSGPAALDAAEIAADLDVRRVGRRVRCEGTGASTNDLAWAALAASPAEADGLAVFAEYQTAGRGRRGSRWLAPPHEAILCSVALVVEAPPPGAAVLTRAAAVAAAEAIEAEAEFDRPRSIGIKWPNDLVVDDRKVGGILVEGRAAGAAGGGVVIGIGINCGQDSQAFPAAIRPHVASLAMMDASADRTLLARRLLERLDRAVALTVAADGLETIRQGAARRCRTLGCRITVAEGETTLTGQVADLDPDYGLVLRLPDGALRRFPAMTTTVLSAGGPGRGRKTRGKP